MASWIRKSAVQAVRTSEFIIELEVRIKYDLLVDSVNYESQRKL